METKQYRMTRLMEENNKTYSLETLPHLVDHILGLTEEYKVLEFHGEMGAGKTTFVRHLLRALGVQGNIKSPTYAVVEPYSVGAGEVWHFDFYRFSDPREWEDAGFRDIFASAGLKLCEWPQNAAGVMPTPDLELALEVDDDAQRLVTLNALTPRGQELLA